MASIVSGGYDLVLRIPKSEFNESVLLLVKYVLCCEGVVPDVTRSEALSVLGKLTGLSPENLAEVVRLVQEDDSSQSADCRPEVTRRSA